MKSALSYPLPVELRRSGLALKPGGYLMLNHAPRYLDQPSASTGSLVINGVALRGGLVASVATVPTGDAGIAASVPSTACSAVGVGMAALGTSGVGASHPTTSKASGSTRSSLRIAFLLCPYLLPSRVRALAVKFACIAYALPGYIAAL